jgi:hypothetical protein
LNKFLPVFERKDDKRTGPINNREIKSNYNYDVAKYNLFQNGMRSMILKYRYYPAISEMLRFHWLSLKRKLNAVSELAGCGDVFDGHGGDDGVGNHEI